MDGYQDVRRAYRDTAIMCGAIVASVVIYAVVVEVLSARLPRGGVGAGVVTDVLRYAHYVVAGVVGLAIPVARRWAETAMASSEGTVLSRLRTGALVAASLAEAPAVLGLVLFLLGRRRDDFYALAGWSLLLHLFHFPRLERWEEAARTAARRGG
jgi:hypothetical protein